MDKVLLVLVLISIVVVVPVMELAVGMEVGEVGGADVMALVVDFGLHGAGEGVVADFDFVAA